MVVVSISEATGSIKLFAFFWCGHKEDLSHLYREAASFSALTRPLDYLVHVTAFEYPQAADMFLGLQIRTIGDEQFAVWLWTQCAGGAKTTGELPHARSDHLAVERVDLFHHRFVLCGRVKVVRQVTTHHVVRHEILLVLCV